jgi:hypothetical protein
VWFVCMLLYQGYIKALYSFIHPFDGPAVNLSFLRELNDSFTSQGIEPVIDLGTCSLHPVHTGLMKGQAVLDFDVDEFTNDIFSWFKLSAARCEDYGEVQHEELLESAGEYFLRPVSSRLSLEPVCCRIIEQYPVMLGYFLKRLPSRLPVQQHVKERETKE